jgi:hypothetical protein
MVRVRYRLYWAEKVMPYPRAYRTKARAIRRVLR